MKGMPFAVSVEPTTSCNLHCVECVTGQNLLTRPKGEIDNELFSRIIDQTYKNLIYLSLYFQGEPFLNKNIFDLISIAKEKKIFTETSTNANLIDDEVARYIVESGLDSLIISIDGATQETYSSYRSDGELQKVKDAIHFINQWKKTLNSKTPFVILQYLVTKQNEHQIDEMKQLVKQLHADALRFKTIQIIEPGKDSDLLPVNTRYSRYRKDKSGKLVLKKKQHNRCFRMWRGCVFTWDGNVLPCCFDKNAEHKLGNISNTFLAEIWHSSAYSDFRKHIFRRRKTIKMCGNCTE
jgi:radical SAM protein with 4Fe4S-binding SPASM domain